jgi:hypothetical protein
MTPAPFAKTPVRAALDASVMEVGFAVKLVIEGGRGFTVMVAVAVDADPLVGVTVSV